MNVYSYVDRVNKRKELEKKLQGEYLKTYRAVFKYLVFRTLNHWLLEEIAQDILDLFLESQSRGEKVQSVIGGDYKKFCDEIISESALKMKPNFLVYFSLGQYMLILSFFVTGLGILELYRYYVGERPTPVFDVTLISAIIVVGTLLGAILISLIIGKSGYSAFKMLLTPLALLLPLLLIGLLHLLTIDMSTVLFRINIILAIAFSWGTYIIAGNKEKKLLQTTTK
ncbi:DUF1048 domain-containing protein [Dethiobacter alkaliphilus]|uniref:Uncharacterized protein n=1 Tax=Dethiobacter alkaliphilus AHT 1 TaxID=555088 RepID=C0GEI7_DETAL|nr:DUF1048 domain-containing protein [Dethiobacter alkaliphilus]EEG78481.1 hypothetical protein DealDRAFT_0896 [Dethiobacter alkaliphilus AHT 1]